MHPSSVPTRRTFLAATAGLAAGSLLSSVPSAARAGRPLTDASPEPLGESSKGAGPVIAISSANGLRTVELARTMMLDGADTLDAAIAGVNIVEDDPDDLTVGYGGLPNEEGVVELDAAVMHGPTHRCGAVGALRNVRHPSKVAKVVMETTDHVLLVGEGALRFARAHGFEEENLLTEKTRKIWLYWRQSRDDDKWLRPPDESLDPDVARFFGRPTGTIHCGALNADGDVSCVTTTSGLAFKIPGRVGDSPIIGAGLYADNAVGSCGSTGRGEANLENLSCFAAVELMRQGASPREAGLEILQRIADRTVPRLRRADGRPSFRIAFYILAKDGRYAGVSMFRGRKFAVADEQGARLEDCVPLFG